MRVSLYLPFKPKIYEEVDLDEELSFVVCNSLHTVRQEFWTRIKHKRVTDFKDQVHCGNKNHISQNFRAFFSEKVGLTDEVSHYITYRL